MTGVFVDGVWTGQVSIGAVGTTSLKATDGASGKIGSSNSFTVASLGALTVTTPPHHD